MRQAIETLRQAIVDEIAELDRLRGVREQLRPSRVDQQSLGVYRAWMRCNNRRCISRMIPGQHRYVALSAALKRMMTGIMATVITDKMIGAGRLAIDPAAMLCVQCA